MNLQGPACINPAPGCTEPRLLDFSVEVADRWVSVVALDRGDEGVEILALVVDRKRVHLADLTGGAQDLVLAELMKRRSPRT